MQIRPVKCYRKPVYPSRLELRIDNSLLKSHQPAGWKRIPTFAGLAALLFFSESCSKTDTTTAQRVPGQGLSPVEEARLAEIAHLTPSSQKKAVVAPLFEHGSGRGVTGCMAINSPVFLSEEEALQIIEEELAHTGIKGDSINAFWDEVTILPVSQSLIFRQPQYPVSKTFNIDIADTTNSIAIEFVSIEDTEIYGGIKTGSFAETHFEILDTASMIREKIQKQGKGMRVGVFYDPVVFTDAEAALRDLKLGGYGTGGYGSANLQDTQEARDYQNQQEQKRREAYQAREEAARQEAMRLLRMQVKDFIDWLKAQGVI